MLSSDTCQQRVGEGPGSIEFFTSLILLGVRASAGLNCFRNFSETFLCLLFWVEEYVKVLCPSETVHLLQNRVIVDVGHLHAEGRMWHSTTKLA